MDYKFLNNTDKDLSNIESFIGKFFPYAQKRLSIDKPVTIILKSDSQNAQKILGKTGYYDPENFEVVVYVDDRHPKDILRSISHELIHHAQNCRGEFDDSLSTSKGYAQEDEKMRKMEMEAYLLSNGDDLMVFRDFEDKLKKDSLQENKLNEPQEQITNKQWYHQELYKKLAKKWSK